MKWVETMLCQNGKIELLELHLQRLQWGLYQNDVQDVVAKIKSIRKYIMDRFPVDNNLYKARYTLELDHQLSLNYIDFEPISNFSTQVYRIGLYLQQSKPLSAPWNAKIADRDLYKNAMVWAKNHQLDDAVIFNKKGNIIETSIFNIWVLKDEVLYTPPLSDNPVKGVFRSWMICNSIFPIYEKSLVENDLRNADLILLSNALRGLQIAKLL